jgi:plastocyanin
MTILPTGRLLARRWRPALAAGAIAAVGVLAGCGGSSSPASGSAAASASPAPRGSQHITIEGTSGLKFTPMTIPVHAGKVSITLKDMGAYPHNVVIPALGVTSKTVTGDPGAGSVSFTVTFKHRGRYAFHCQYHQSAGMVGVFVVS